MTIIYGSLSVSGPIQIVASDGNGVIAPVDLTGMTLEARFFDVGMVGQGRGVNYDYGFQGRTQSLALVTVPQGVEADGPGYLVVSDPATGMLYISMSPGQTHLIWANSTVEQRLQKQVTRQIWRTDVGAESMLREDTEWARA